MQALGWLWLATGIVGIIDAFRHSQSDWTHADRNRGFWVVMMFFFGPIAATIYVLSVRSRFPKGEGDTVSAPFKKADP